MALNFSRRIIQHTSSASNPINAGSVTVNAGECVLTLALKVRGASDRTGGAPTLGTFTAVQRNSTQKAAATPEASAELWDFLNVPPGSYTLTIPNAGALTVFYELDAAASDSGGKAEFDAANGGNNTSTNPTPGAVTRSAPGNFSIAVVATGAQTWAPSPQAGTNIHNTDDGADGTGLQYVNGGTGSLTLNWTFGTSDDWGAVVATYKEVPPVALNNYAASRFGTNVAAMRGSG